MSLFSKPRFVELAACLALVLGMGAADVEAAVNQKPAEQKEWSFDKKLGTFDAAARQRGFQVFKEVCSSCHSVDRLKYRHLQDIGFSKAEVKAIAAADEVHDGPNDEGDMFDRPGKPNDFIDAPYDNEKAARVANNGAYPPDLTLMIKARKDGANYLYSLLTGYEAAPAGASLLEGQYWNPYFPDGKLMMAPPLTEGQVDYDDGTKATIEQMAHDVVTFLAWAAEPEMENRKQLGVKVLIYLLIMTLIFYFSMRKIWAPVKRDD